MKQIIYLGTTKKYLAAHRFYEKNAFRNIAKDGLPKTFSLVYVDTIFYQRKPYSIRLNEYGRHKRYGLQLVRSEATIQELQSDWV